MKIFMYIIGIFSFFGFLYWNRSRILCDDDKDVRHEEMKELMELCRKGKAIPSDYVQYCINKTRALLRDFSYERYLEIGNVNYQTAFIARLRELLGSLEIDSITNLPNRETEILKVLDAIYNATGFSIIKAQENETINRFILANMDVSVFFPDPKLNYVMKFHHPRINNIYYVDKNYVLENFFNKPDDIEEDVTFSVARKIFS